jgi:hypothetical protein
VKVRGTTIDLPALLGRYLVAIPLSMALTLGAAAPAHAITRTTVLDRANAWIKKKVPYSQSGHYQGYRRDCSGFVSMAWSLGTSYTSDTIASRAKRIPMRSLKPGDAVRRPGHVEIFAGWKNLRKRQYIALEEQTWGRPALRTVKQFKGGYSALRLRGIEDTDAAAPASDPTIPAAPAPAPPSDSGGATSTVTLAAPSIAQ